MKFTGKISKTIATAAIFTMFAVPAMASSEPQGGFLAGKVLGNGTGDIVLLASGGNGSGNGSGDRDGSGSGDRDRDRDRDQDGSCLDNVTATSISTALILAGNGKGSGDQDRDRDRAKDASCQS